MAWFALPAFTCYSQWDVPVRAILDGPAQEDRQVTGLADPVSEDAGLSLQAVRNGTTSTAYSTGSLILIASLNPPLSAYGNGMMITLIPDTQNSPGAQLDLDGLGPRPLVKWGGLPLDSADLLPGSPVRLIYDGALFQVVGNVTLPCPETFSAVTNSLCIMDSSRTAASFFAASVTCGSMNARLCSFSEWAYACRSRPAFLNTVLELEWVDSATNSTNQVKEVGVNRDTLEIGCEYGDTGSPFDPRRYRCCKNR